MPGWLESLLVSLALAVLEKLLKQGSEAANKFLELRKAIEKARKYQKVVDSPINSREERRHAEDDFLS